MNDSANYASLSSVPLFGLRFPSACGQNKDRWENLWHFLHAKQLGFVPPCPDVAFAYFSLSLKEMMLAYGCHAFLIEILDSTKMDSRDYSKSSLFPPGEALKEQRSIQWNPTPICF